MTAEPARFPLQGRGLRQKQVPLRQSQLESADRCIGGKKDGHPLRLRHTGDKHVPLNSKVQQHDLWAQASQADAELNGSFLTASTDVYQTEVRTLIFGFDGNHMLVIIGADLEFDVAALVLTLAFHFF